MLKADSRQLPAGTTFSLGHSNLAIEDVCALLNQHGIAMVADVRRFPQSRRHPRFDRDALAAALNAAGISYVWCGESLGGFRSGGYESYMTTDAFHRGIADLESMAHRSPTAIMCAERDPAACHRRFIGDALVRRGWRVLHILPGAVFPHSVAEGLFPPDQGGSKPML